MTHPDSIRSRSFGTVNLLSPSADGRLWPHDGRADCIKSARIYAEMAHQGQTDKSGEPYINHLSRVAKSVETLGQDFEIVAWLHDVMEDRPDLIDDLRCRVSPKVDDALIWLARDKGDSYRRYIHCVCHYGNELAVAVKLADLFDHLRYGSWSVLTPEHTQRYIDAIATIHRSQSADTKVQP